MSRTQKLLGIHAVLFGLYAIAENGLFPYQFSLLGDAFDYWTDAENISTPFHPFHVPFYPALIALLNGITFHVLPPLFSMRLITFGGWLLSAVYFDKLLRDHFYFPAGKSLWATLIFSLWPVVALTYTQFPIADSVAIAFFMGGTYYLLNRQLPLSFLLLGLTLVTHKFFWPLTAISLLLWLVLAYRQIDLKLLGSGLLLILPLAGLYVAGYLHYGSPTWIIDTNLEHEFAVQDQDKWPILEAFRTELFKGFSWSGLMKSLIILAVILTSLITLIKAFGKKLTNRDHLFIVGIPLTLLLFALVLNANEIWAVARFSRLLAIPIFAFWLGHSFRLWTRKGILIALLALFLASNMAYGSYVQKFLRGFEGSQITENEQH